MKRFEKSILGVTLLEIMLVLAIAAMIIVMSVRYYQSATSSQQANSVLEQIQGIVAAADGLAQATGTYSGNVTSAAIAPLLPAGGMTAPWGQAITFGTVSKSSYVMNVPGVPNGVCTLLESKLHANNHFSYSGSCGSGSTLAVTYIANP